jgi:branched-chain amino acid transport system permease protein
MSTPASRSTWMWGIAIAIALALPWAFFDWSTHRHSGFALTMLSEIGLMVVFALSYNMLMGQAGLLSFGHAILFGLGGYCTAHAMNAIKASGLWFPMELVPLLGGLGGAGFGIVIGYVATKQRATAFAMITMGLGELVGAAALMFMGFFGGESGITTDRVIEASLVGASYSAPWQVYYLIVAWMLVSVVLMRLQTQTALGKMANAQRDNFERTQFVGYDPQRIRFWQFVVAGFFAGIAGALYAILYEIVTFDAVSATKSANALLASYIGGVGSFFGPAVGAALVVLLQSGLSLLSNSWVMYVGVLFIAMVMYAPGGIAGIFAAHAPIARIGRLRELAVPYLRILVPGLIAVLGFVTLVELTSFLTIGAAQGKQFKLGSATVDAASSGPWLFGFGCLLIGAAWLRYESRGFMRVWNALIEQAKAAEGGQ